ncbi:MAG: enoyl-CoA hydratase-related protein, partial [Pseudomonadota bacterium]
GAKFAFTETTIGLSPAQISPFVLQRVGARNGRRLMLLAETLTGEDAGAVGLVDQLVDGTAGMDKALAGIRKQLERCAPGAVADTKALLLDIPSLSRQQQQKQAAENFADRMVSDEAREGIASFLEKRKPHWAQT